MTYSRYYLRSRWRFPLILAGVALLSVVALVYVMTQPPAAPKTPATSAVSAFQVVNLGSGSAGVFWQTTQPSTGYLRLGTQADRLTTTVGDGRDLDAKAKGKYRFHYAPLSQLTPQTRYYYRIVSGAVSTPSSDQPPAYFITPLNTVTDLSPKMTLGKVVDRHNQPVSDAFVIFRFDQYGSLLTQTKLTGEWLMPLTYLVELDQGKNRVVTSVDTTPVTVEIISPDGQKASVTTDVTALLTSNRTITLGKNYRFLSAAQVLGVSDASDPKQAGTISIIYPKDGAVIAAAHPLLKGKALSGQAVWLSINSQPQQNFRVTADNQGDWRVLFTPAIAAGKYRLTLTTKDQAGKEVTVIHQFTIAKSGEQVLGEATGEAQPTITMAVTVTATPTAIALVSPSLSATPPVTGVSQNLWFIGSIALTVVGAGLLLAF
ncbi:fibronectin type III domain-containing protein [Patescibacteria group bacterium]|nr:fibronectin type III domain-containing protein [Patescibacteria group bacterium]MCL5091719.1 fibronectin type III domain-containing protein [Patescibacteria group bacterium]